MCCVVQEARYEPGHPLEKGPHVRVFALRDRKEERDKVLTLFPALRRKSGVSLEHVFDFRRALRHPCLIPVLDVAFRGNHVGVVTPRLTGPSLFTSTRTLKARKECAAKMLALLAWLHRRKFFCGLLKPSQFFREGCFGLCANILLPAVEDAPPVAADSRYAAPEFSATGRADIRSDLYSAGMVLYELFTGIPPFLEEDREVLRDKRRAVHPRRPRLIDPDLPREIEDAIVLLTQRDPDARPASAQGAAEILGIETGVEVESPEWTAPLFGREQELEALRHTLDAFAEEGRFGIVVVGGEPGIGKTRVLQRFELAAKLRRRRTGWIRCDATALDPDSVPASGVVLHRQPEGSRDMPKGLVAACRRKSALLVIESSDRQLVAHLRCSTSCDSPPSRIRTIRLERLAASHLESLMEWWVDCRPPASLRERLVTEAGGNPLFLRERLRQLIRPEDDGSARRRIQQAIPAGSERVPSRVRTSVETRLKRLKPRHREIVETLAIIDSPLTLQFLSRILELDLEALETAADALNRGEWISRGGTLVFPRVVLRHLWLGPAVRASIPPRRAKRIHRRAAASFETEAGSIEGRATAAGHWLAAGETHSARKHLDEALDFLEAAGRLGEAAKLMERALRAGCFDESDPGPQLRLAQLCGRSGLLDRCIHHCRALLERDDGLADADRGQALLLIGRSHLLRGRTSDAARALESAFAAMRRASNSSLECEVCSELLGCASFRGDFADAKRWLGVLFTGSRERRALASHEKACHAFFLYSYYVRGSIPRSLIWEGESIRQAFLQGRRNRGLGRLAGMAILYSDFGLARTTDRVTGFLKRELARNDNTEISLFRDYAAALNERLRGRPLAAQRSLEFLADRCGSPNPQRNMLYGILIEQAKCLINMLHPDKALRALARCQNQLLEEYNLPAAVDATLAQSRAWALLGRTDEAEACLDGFDWERLRYRSAELLILRSEIEYLRGDDGGSLDNARRVVADRVHAPRHWARARLAETRALLRLGQAASSRQSLRAVRQTCSREGLIPLETESHLLEAAIDVEQKRLRIAKGRTLLVLARLREGADPLRESRALALLGKIRLAEGDAEGYLVFYSRAIRRLRDSLAQIRPALRAGFRRLHLRPLEEMRSSLMPIEVTQVPNYLGRLCTFLSEMPQDRDPGRLAAFVLEGALSCIPGAGRALLRRTSGRLDILLERGTCRISLGRVSRELADRNGRELLQLAERERTALVIPLQGENGCSGCVQLEWPTNNLSEVDFDFLRCLARSATRLRAPEEGPVHSAPAETPPDLSFSFVARDPSMKRLLDLLRRIAPTTATVLITGESGTGKELVARAIHQWSRRAGGPFIPVNCSSMPEGLIESELFGHERGSFTGANASRRGLFEAAHHGTLFLDEVATMPLALQSGLLRAIQEKRIRRVGDSKERDVDVRIVCATNQPLSQLVADGRFRPDLYHRLKVFEVLIPPLRERLEDIPALAKHFLEQLRNGEGVDKEMSPDALQRLSLLSFPGNVRELRNLLESAAYISPSKVLTAADFPGGAGQAQQPSAERAEAWVRRLQLGEFDFWADVRDPFLNRDLSRSEVKAIVAAGLARCEGRYRDLIKLFRLPPEDYKRFLGFLSSHDCKVDFRPYRHPTP